jgi:hypothetical protein
MLSYELQISLYLAIESCQTHDFPIKDSRISGQFTEGKPERNRKVTEGVGFTDWTGVA